MNERQLNAIVEESLLTVLSETANSVTRLRAENAILLKALERIAYEPQGRAEASHREVLNAVERIAKDALIEVHRDPELSGTPKGTP